MSALVRIPSTTPDITLICRSKEQRGHLSYGPAAAFLFASAKQLGVPDTINSWEDHARVKYTDSLEKAVPPLRAGLEKQYKFQEKFISDSSQAQAE